MKLIKYLLSAILAGTAVQAALAEKPMVIRFSHTAPANSPKGQATEKFAQLVAQRTDGKVNIVIFPEGQLWGERAEMAALLIGGVEMLAPPLAKLKVLNAPEFEVFDAPFLLRNLEDVHRVTGGAIGSNLFAKLEPQGVIGLAVWDNGFNQMSSNHGYVGYGVIANKKFWDDLPADYRGVLEQALRDATVYANELAQKSNQEALESIKKTGRTQVIELTESEKLAWRHALSELREQAEPRTPKTLIRNVPQTQGYAATALVQR